ncbi:MAG: ABC transporter ATP-binding protein [Saprospiraceae bacterium]|nr:ABC transporter ATP-binding protein [Saprospiraceae bacterium]
MIQFENVSKRFGSLEVLKNVNLDMASGHCIALIGPNGCGKTTFIKSLLGMVIPDEGSIHVNGAEIIHQHLHRAGLGYMPQIGKYPGNLTIGQLIDMVRHLRPDQPIYDEYLIDSFGLRTLQSKKMATLSGGTIQKVSAALAFLFNPPVLVLDEPTAGLDPLSSETLKLKISQEVINGKLVLITSHILSELDDLVSHIIFMQEGRILFHKSVEALLAETKESKISKAIVTLLAKTVNS